MVNRRQFVCSATASVIALAREPAAFAAEYDLIIKGGRIVDPSLHVNAILRHIWQLQAIKWLYLGSRARNDPKQASINALNNLIFYKYGLFWLKIGLYWKPTLEQLQNRR